MYARRALTVRERLVCFVFEYVQGDEGYVLLGRMEGNVPGYLSYSADEGEVVCVFRGAAEAEEFYMHWRDRIPGEGWGAMRPSTEDLIRVLQNFDLVSVSPQPNPGVTEYLYTVEDFARSLREPR